MILPGEYKLTSDYVADIVYSSSKVVNLMNKALILCKEETNSNVFNYRFEELVAGIRLSGNTMQNSSQINNNYSLNLFFLMTERIKKQYNISLDQFLEEQFIELNKDLYDSLTSFSQNNPTARLGSKYARWQDIDVNINEIHTSKYSNVKMNWSFIGALNTD